MKHAILFPLLSICMLQVNSQFAYFEKTMVAPNYLSYDDNNGGPNIGALAPCSVAEAMAQATELCEGEQADQGNVKMSATIFKNQKYCRAELKDFEFDFHFSIVGADVYFSGANFNNIEKATIKSNELKPLKNLMDRCIPGTVVVFDNVKVIGNDKILRVIPGVTYLLK